MALTGNNNGTAITLRADITPEIEDTEDRINHNLALPSSDVCYYETTLECITTPINSGKELIYSILVYDKNGNNFDTNGSGSINNPNGLGSGDRGFEYYYRKKVTSGTANKAQSLWKCTGNIYYEDSTGSQKPYLSFLNKSEDNEIQNAQVLESYNIYYKYKLNFNINGGSGENPASVRGASYTQSAESLAVTSTVPVKTGHHFLGWANSASATTPQYTSANNDTVPFDHNNPEQTLYAVWEADFTLYLNYDNGTNSVESVKGYGATTIPTSVNPTKTNYYFTGQWSTEPNGGGTVYDAGESITLAANTTLYAVYAQYSISFVPNAEGVTQMPEVKGGYGTTSLPQQQPHRLSYKFLGWLINDVLYEAGENINLMTDVTAAAQWEFISNCFVYDAERDLWLAAYPYMRYNNTWTKASIKYE